MVLRYNIVVKKLGINQLAKKHSLNREALINISNRRNQHSLQNKSEQFSIIKTEWILVSRKELSVDISTEILKLIEDNKEDCRKVKQFDESQFEI